MTKLNSNYKGWDTDRHLKTFDGWNKRCNLEFNYVYGSFAEQKYLLKAIKHIENPKIIDVGCATATTYRFLRNILKNSAFSYKGLDLSSSVIERARFLYPGIDILQTSGERPLEAHGSKVDIVYSRDTTLHQEDPYDFLDQLIDLTDKFLIIRLRTRDNGKSELDISKSLQMHYDSFWMPYFVLNIDELISYFKNKKNLTKVTINRSYEVLGGQNNRLLPKDLYFKKAKGAETSIMIEFDYSKKEGDAEIVYDTSIQGRQFLIKNRWNLKFLIFKLISKLMSK